jgi:23S rRNA (cytidine1920-2'-O)/16S rRNA (cytidine1409-2'-O)-methyltransferase
MRRGRRRLDEVLVSDGNAPDLDVARTLIEQGHVRVAGAPALNAARAVRPDEAVSVVAPERFVGRGGHKLEAVLDRFELDVGGHRVLDVGASTGGFTDCLVQRGAAKVLSVDVGHEQLHERLGADERVVSMERTNALDLQADVVAAVLGGAPEFLTIDVSFTSLGRLVGHLLELSSPDAHLVALVKPQFETSHAEASRGRGVVSDPAVWRDAMTRCASAIERAAAGIIGVMASPLRGAAGNAEFFIVAARGRTSAPVDVVQEWIGAAVDAASSVR